MAFRVSRVALRRGFFAPAESPRGTALSTGERGAGDYRLACAYGTRRREARGPEGRAREERGARGASSSSIQLARARVGCLCRAQLAFYRLAECVCVCHRSQAAALCEEYVGVVCVSASAGGDVDVGRAGVAVQGLGCSSSLPQLAHTRDHSPNPYKHQARLHSLDIQTHTQTAPRQETRRTKKSARSKFGPSQHHSRPRPTPSNPCLRPLTHQADRPRHSTPTAH